MSAAPPANPVHACVAFARIPQFEELPVVEQAQQKEQLEARVLAALGPVRAEERVVLDAEAGLALILFGDVERALDVAVALQGRGGDNPMQVGLNYGPLALTSQGSDGRVFGDGLAEAAAAARFATPERLLVTERYAKALKASSPDRATELVPAGDYTDTRVRQHHFLTPDAERRAKLRRRVAMYAAGGAIVILLIGVLGRDVYQTMLNSRPAIVKLEVKPGGEIFVDGLSVGRAPPLTQVEIPPGSRRIQIRERGHRPYEATLELKPGQRLTLTHTLARIPDPPKKKPEPDFWRDFKKKFS
jgi:hypothetical protein